MKVSLAILAAKWVAISAQTAQLILGGDNLDADPARQAADQSLLWGTYRPGLYFGLKPRLPNSLITGVMWYGANDYKGFESIRHECDQRDNMASYGFTQHDARSAAVEVIKDTENNVELSISWLKVPGKVLGGSWAYRVNGNPINPGLPSRTTFVNYFGQDGNLGWLKLDSEKDKEGLVGPIELSGQTDGLGEFTIKVVDNPANPLLTTGRHADDFGDRLHRTHFFGGAVPAGQVWRAKDIFKNVFVTTAKPLVDKYGQNNLPDPALLLALPNDEQPGASAYWFQKTYEGEWSVDVFFDSKEVPSRMDAGVLDVGLEAARVAFEARFERTFPGTGEFSDRHSKMARDVTANLVGGIGYFHGEWLADRSTPQDELDYGEPAPKDRKPEVMPAQELLTATPSRSFFPRGFYWDEGFHLLHVGAWDNDLSLEILKSWIGLIDDDGWVAREQILGDEARSRVPADFQAQYPNHANPPTLVLAVTAYIDRLKAAGVTLDSIDKSEPDGTSPEELGSLMVHSPQRAAAYLRSIYKPLRRHYLWFRRTQRGQVSEWGRRPANRKEGYRWNGRTRDHVLTSGLDDYPRAEVPHVGELHVDLLSWVGSFARTMGEIAGFLGEEYEEDLEEYEDDLEGVLANLEMHWSEEEEMYCDLSVNSDDESIHVCHPGYVSLFPLLLGLLPPSSPHLAPLLDMINDPAQLWSPAGIRSLSKRHSLYGKGENYWRGPVWMPMNYMALTSLFKVYARAEGPSQVRAGETYARLRGAIVENMLKEYERTGFVWEQYHPETGEGQRSHAFTGWSSLYALILAEHY